MKKKIVILAVWILFTCLYCWNLSDIGRSMGANTNSAIETYAEMINKYSGTTTDLENLGDAIGDSFIYNEFNNLSNEFKTDLMIIGITSIIYIVITLTCYYFAFIKKKQ